MDKKRFQSGQSADVGGGYGCVIPRVRSAAGLSDPPAGGREGLRGAQPSMDLRRFPTCCESCSLPILRSLGTVCGEVRGWLRGDPDGTLWGHSGEWRRCCLRCVRWGPGPFAWRAVHCGARRGGSCGLTHPLLALMGAWMTEWPVAKVRFGRRARWVAPTGAFSARG